MYKLDVVKTMDCGEFIVRLIMTIVHNDEIYVQTQKYEKVILFF